MKITNSRLNTIKSVNVGLIALSCVLLSQSAFSQKKIQPPISKSNSLIGLFNQINLQTNSNDSIRVSFEKIDSTFVINMQPGSFPPMANAQISFVISAKDLKSALNKKPTPQISIDTFSPLKLFVDKLNIQLQPTNNDKSTESVTAIIWNVTFCLLLIFAVVFCARLTRYYILLSRHTKARKTALELVKPETSISLAEALALTSVNHLDITVSDNPQNSLIELIKSVTKKEKNKEDKCYCRCRCCRTYENDVDG